MKQSHRSGASVRSWAVYVGMVVMTGIGQTGVAADSSAPAGLFSVSSVTNVPDTTPPSVPTNLTVLAVSPRKVVLGWDAATDDSGAVVYNLMRDRALWAEGLTETTYIDLQVRPEETHEYQVQAVDRSGNESLFTPVVTATTPAEQLVDTPGLRFEVWNHIDPPTLSTLVNDPRFLAGQPDYRALATAADSRTVYSSGAHTNYGGRLSGFLVPRNSGKYEFFLRSEDASQLWLSPDEQPANRVRLAEETTCCAPFQEPGDPRTSAPITLVAGRLYALEVLWVAGAGPGYAQVAWRQADDPTPAGALYPIPGEFLLTPWDPNVGPPAVTNKLFDFPTLNTNATLQVQAMGEPPIAVAWAPWGGEPIPGATNTTLVLTNVALNRIGSIYTATLQNTFGSTEAHFALIPNGSLFVEAEDFNFDAGRSIEDQPTGMTGPYPGGSYFGKGTEADFEIDYRATGSDGTAYRAATGVAVSQPNPQPEGLSRGRFDVQINHVVVSTEAGDWYNYTRVFPSPPGNYYVFGRFASESPVLAQLDTVTSGSTTNQLGQRLGEFKPGRGTGSTNQFETFPLLDTTGAPVVLTNWAGEMTLRVTLLPGSSPNFDYLVFVPTTPRPSTGNEFTSVTRQGSSLVLVWASGTLEWADSVTGPWQPVPNATSPYTYPITGTSKFFRLR